MNISFTNVGAKNGMTGAGVVEANKLSGDESRAAEATSGLTIGMSAAGISAGEPIADVPDSALTRDDKLGQLVGAAFNLQPPSMPDFS